MGTSIRALGTTARVLIAQALCVLLLGHATVANAIHPPYTPPTWSYHGDSFGDDERHASWQTVLGTWSIAGGTYNSTAAVSTALTTIYDYPDWWFSGPVTTVEFTDYRLNARMLNQSGGASTVGLVYHYQDAANYREVVFSASGTASLRSVVDGVATTVASTAYPGGGQGVWFAVELIVEANNTSTVRVNGLEIMTRVSTPMEWFGQAGFSTHGAVAKFDDFAIEAPVEIQAYQETFDDGTVQNLGAQAGQWSVAGGTYNSGTVQQASVALAGIPDQTVFGPLDFVLRARMLNPYGASGNQVGLVFNFTGDTYDQVVFSPTGIARLDHVSGITAQTVATATYGGRRNEWFDVTLFDQFTGVSVAVNGQLIFADVSGFGHNVDGSLGLITHWAPGKFDDVSFGYYAAFPYFEGFAAGLPSGWSVNGTWTVSEGTLQASSVVATSSAKAPAARQTGFVLRARMLNQYTASGNLVGLMYEGTAGSQGQGDHYEVVFAPTGQAYLDKYVKGVRSRIATATHSIPSNTWFNVELTRSDVYTTVRVNGVTLFNRVAQAHLPSASLGLVTHWTKARFDNVSLSEIPR